MLNKIDKSDKHTLYVNDGKDISAFMKWDGCCQIFIHYNGSDINLQSGDGVDTIHICYLEDFIGFLQELKEESKKYFDTKHTKGE